MALPRPQRESLEFIARKSTPWLVGISQEKIFYLTSGEQIHFLGVSNGTEMFTEMFAVFGFNQPKDSAQNEYILPMCRFGALITGPDSEGWSWAEGLKIASVNETDVVLRLNGRRAQYRPI